MLHGWAYDSKVEDWGGTKPVLIKENGSRTFLMDGDKIILEGWCKKSGFRSIGFGTVEGIVLPALER